ncbi:MAG: ATPase domain-containing protein [Prochloraceae cyanobacterium]|nr:ATPase domain-containing protein [Prochloraceae cyanobacterium]
MNRSPGTRLGKLSTNIPGLDEILSGGLPELSTNIITGPPGAGKTIFTQQLIYTNASPQRKVLYLITLSEPSVKMLHYLQKFDFFVPEKVGKEVIYLDIGEVIRASGLDEAIDLIIKHVQEFKPAIVGIDSFKAIHDLARDPVEVRKFGYDLSVKLTTWAVTSLLIGEYTQKEIETEPIFAIADGIIRLHNEPLGLHYQRYLDVLKLRGEDCFTGRHPFSISYDGLTVYPRIKRFSSTPSTEDIILPKASTGVEGLDRMLEGGLPGGTSTMIAGGAGTGKTLMGLHFITSGAIQGEPGVIVTFQENYQQLRNIARSFGWDLRALEEENKLIHLYSSPVEIQPDIHAAHVKAAVEKIDAKRVFLDSLKDIEIATPDKVRYKDYIYSLVNELKLRGITSILTNEIPELFGPFQLSEYGVSFIADNVILLRYVELSGKMGRAINIMKVRGSQHSKEICSFEINNNGIQIEQPIKAQTGILAGMPVLGNHQLDLSYLPIRARFVVQTLKQIGTLKIEQLSQSTGLSEENLIKELEELQEQGLVLVIPRKGIDYYKATI